MNIIIIFLLISLQAKCYFANDYENLSLAIKKISEEIIVHYTTDCNVIVTNLGCESSEFHDKFLKILMTDPRLKVRQQMIQNVKPLITKTPRKFSIVAIQTRADFGKFMDRLKPELFEYSGHFILVLIKGEFINLSRIFDDLWKLQIHDVIAVYENSDRTRIEIATYFPFRLSNGCSNTSPVTVNEYVNGTFLRGLQNIFVNKMKNLKQCQVKIATSLSQPPHIFSKQSNDGEIKFYGRDYDLIRTMASSLNFKVNFTIFSDDGCVGALQGLNRTNNADIVIVDCWLKQKRLQFFEASTTYFLEKIVVIFPLTPELSSFEKLFRPLSATAWCILSSCIIIGTAVIFIVKKLPREIQNFVFGRNIKHQYLNIFTGLLAVPFLKLPKRNFSRYILMNFLLFTFVMRSAYQAKLFQIMQAHIHHPEPKTIQEMTELGYKLHISESFLELTRNNKNTKFM